MSRRIEVELTSARPDGSWTWRAAGAREPRGVMDGNLLRPGAKVGDVLKVEADIDLEGISVLQVIADKAPRAEPERLELIGSTQPFEPVVTTLATKQRSDRPPRRDRPPRTGDDADAASSASAARRHEPKRPRSPARSSRRSVA